MRVHDEVDLVAHTHLHVDHVGWDGSFPNARYVVPTDDWSYFMSEESLQQRPHLGDRVEPLGDAGLVVLVDGELEVASGIRLVPTSGHTPGHASVFIESEGSELVVLGDDVVVENTEGTVEEIGLIYTFVRTENGDRLVIPNEKLASDTIRNSTIRSREKVAEISLQVPLGKDLGAVVDRLRTLAADGEVFVNDLSADATVVVRVPAPNRSSAEQRERELRLQAYEVLRAAGVYA